MEFIHREWTTLNSEMGNEGQRSWEGPSGSRPVALTVLQGILAVPGEEVLLGSGGWRPGVLLSVLQGTGHPPSKGLSLQSVSNAEIGKIWSGLRRVMTDICFFVKTRYLQKMILN